MILAKPRTDVSGVRSSWLTVERNELLAASASSAIGSRLFRFLEQAPDFVLVLVQLFVGVGVVECDGRVRRQAAEHVQVMLGVGKLLEALDRDDAEHTILGDERQVDERLRLLRHRAILERLARLV